MNHLHLHDHRAKESHIDFLILAICRNFDTKLATSLKKLSGRASEVLTGSLLVRVQLGAFGYFLFLSMSMLFTE